MDLEQTKQYFWCLKKCFQKWNVITRPLQRMDLLKCPISAGATCTAVGQLTTVTRATSSGATPAGSATPPVSGQGPLLSVGRSPAETLPWSLTRPWLCSMALLSGSPRLCILVCQDMRVQVRHYWRWNHSNGLAKLENYTPSTNFSIEALHTLYCKGQSCFFQFFQLMQMLNYPGFVRFWDVVS